MSQPLNPSVQPTDVYGGDEISALVLDPGYCYTRAGFAGEDVPKSVIPSAYGHVGSRDPPLELFGEDYMMPRPDMEIRNYMSRDSVVEDWDVATRLWENMLVRSLHAAQQTPASRNGLNDDLKDDAAASAAAQQKKDTEGDVSMGDDVSGAAGTDNNISNKQPDVDAQEKSLQENPLLMSEAPWNSPKAREKAIEVIMENWGCPAFWMSRTPVLAAFAAGKATALVIDVGGANTSVTAIHDGMVLKKSIQRSPVGGLWLSGQIRSMFASSTPKVEVVPTFMVESKQPVEAGAPASARLRTFDFPISDSFRALHEDRTLLQFKESVVEVWHHRGKFLDPGNEDIVRSQPGPVFEFPNGTNQMWHEQRYRVSEGMFDEAAQFPIPDEAAITASQTIPELVRAAVNAVDVDVRGNLLANVVITGGTSLVKGFTERLNTELQNMYPSLKIRTTAAGLTTERRFGAWVGGSILSSLGTFHQMWISRKEYEENGAGIVEKRCK